MDQSVLVPYEFRAPLVIERKLALHEALELLIAAQVDAVPEFGLAMVQVVDAVKIHVLFVPPENGFPGTNIHVGIRNSRNFLITEPITTGLEIIKND